MTWKPRAKCWLGWRPPFLAEKANTRYHTCEAILLLLLLLLIYLKLCPSLDIYMYYYRYRSYHHHH